VEDRRKRWMEQEIEEEDWRMEKEWLTDEEVMRMTGECKEKDR